MKDNMDFWQDVMDGQPASFDRWFMREKEFLRGEIAPGDSVLEVGCGHGRSMLDIVDRAGNVVGIDHDPKAIEVAKTAFAGHTNASFLVAKADQLPFNDEQFDDVMCMSTFVNFADEKYAALADMKRVLKHGGKILMSVYNEDALKDRLQNYHTVGLRIKSVNNGTVVFDEDFTDNVSEQFSEAELRDIFTKSDLKIQRIEKLEVAYLLVLTT